jgi:hypothetical protein
MAEDLGVLRTSTSAMPSMTAWPMPRHSLAAWVDPSGLSAHIYGGVYSMPERQLGDLWRIDLPAAPFSAGASGIVDTADAHGPSADHLGDGGGGGDASAGWVRGDERVDGLEKGEIAPPAGIEAELVSQQPANLDDSAMSHLSDPGNPAGPVPGGSALWVLPAAFARSGPPRGG